MIPKLLSLLFAIIPIASWASEEPGALPKNHRGIYGSNTEKFTAIEKQLPLTRAAAWNLVLAHDRKVDPKPDGRKKLIPRKEGPVVDGNYFFTKGPLEKFRRSWRGYIINPYSKVIIRTRSTSDDIIYTKRSSKEFTELEKNLPMNADEAYSLVVEFDKKFEPRTDVARPTRNALIIGEKYFFPLGKGKRTILKRNWNGYYFDPKTKKITRSYHG